MEILQEIGSYAGLAAVLGLAVLSALYFSQARDVKRLREWAGRAPERGVAPGASQPAQPRGVVAQPIARPASRPVPGGTPPPVPRPPGAQPAPASAAAASATGAGPVVASGPAPATPAATPPGDAQGPDDELHEGDESLEGEEREVDVTTLDTEVHPPPSPDGDEDDGEGVDGVHAADGGEAVDEEEGADGDGELDGDEDGFDDDHATAGEDADEATVIQRPGDAAAVGAGETGEHDLADGDEPVDEGTGEWRPEDEHSDFDFTDEQHDAVAPATPAAGAARPPTPPRPYQRRAPATPYGRERSTILPPYEESRPSAGDAPARGGRRTVLVAIGVVLALVVGVFAVLQLTGDDGGDSGSPAGLSAGGSGSGSGGDGGSDQPPVDPSQVTVAVLNGTTVPGLAATIGDQVAGAGFRLGTVTNNFDQEKAESVVLYAPGAEREAAAVGRRLKISQREEIDAESQALAGDATVVVVAGADQNQ